jgi:hypothetical protein
MTALNSWKEILTFLQYHISKCWPTNVRSTVELMIHLLSKSNKIYPHDILVYKVTQKTA